MIRPVEGMAGGGRGVRRLPGSRRIQARFPSAQGLVGPSTMGPILIYEPDDLMRRLLQEWLTVAGYAVHGALAVDPDVGVSLIIASVAPTELERQLLIPRLQREHPDAAVIALCSQARSGLSSDGALARAVGMERVIAKPLRRSELLTIVAALIGPPLRH